ncbi:hypothetical protein [Embleya sp. NPDC005575]|uniref:hypothetical protein n=1 Tax=Embleya sp. NPDC005575 TaxID=3156892 RepID=UPI0033B18A16
MSDLVKLVTEWDKIEFESGDDIRRYRQLLQAIGSEMYTKVYMDADILAATLGAYKGKWFEFGAGVRLRARLVSSHLKVGAEGPKILGVAVAKMHSSYIRHFVNPELAAKAAKTGATTTKGKSFKIKEAE